MAKEITDWEEIKDWEEVADPNAAIAPVNTEPSMLKSAAIGAFQGATFDFGDEALAAIQAIMSDKPYRELQQENEAAAKQAADINPVSYYTGNIGAGIAFNPLAKGVAAGTKTVGAAAATIAPKLKALAQAAPTLPKIAQMGAEGAVYGGLLGAGQASADDDLLSEVGQGAGVGMAIGTTLGGITEIGKKALAPITKRLKDADVFESYRDQVASTRKGYDPTLKETLKKVDAEIAKETEDFIVGVKGKGTSSLPDLRKTLGEELNTIRTTAAKAMPNFTIPIDTPYIKNLSTILKKGETSGPILDQGERQFAKILNSFGFVDEAGEVFAKQLTAPEAISIHSQIGDILADKVPGLHIVSPSITERLTLLSKAVFEPVENAIINSGQFPQYKEINRAFQKVANTQKRLQVKNYYRGDDGAIFRDTNAIMGKVKQLFNENTMTGQNFRRGTELLREVVDSPGFTLLPAQAQDDLKKVVERLDKFEDLSRARALSLDAKGSTTPDSKGLMFLMNSYRAMVMKTLGVILDMPEVAKLASDELISSTGTSYLGKARNVAKKAIDIDYYFNKLTEMANTRGNTELAKTLEYIGQQDMKKRRAMVFVLMQQPGVREIMKEEPK